MARDAQYVKQRLFFSRLLNARQRLHQSIRSVSSKSSNKSILAGLKIVAKRRIRSSVRNTRIHYRLYMVDIAAVAITLMVALLLRFGVLSLYTNPEQARGFVIAGPVYVLLCAIVFPFAGLYSRNWRYGSISDLFSILKAVSLASVLLVCVLFLAIRLETIPRSVVVLEAMMLVALLTLARLSFRLDELRGFVPALTADGARSEKSIPMLLVGAGDAADLYLRALRRDLNSTYWPVGFLDANSALQGMTLRSVPILGTMEDFDTVVGELRQQDQMPRHVVFTESPSRLGEASAEQLIQKAEKLGMTVSRLARPTELKSPRVENRFELKSIELTDLLERPQTALDTEAIKRFIHGRRVLVTGAGGSIGSELTLQIAACGPAEIVMIENCEFNLYSIDMELSERFPDVQRASYLCNIRRPKRVDEIFDRHMPELVFHAAALKHVPMVELNPCEGVLTNSIGTMNVATAASRTGALAMVQVSTDKVVNSTSVMGATKRLAELYCQALDLDGFDGGGPRFMTVRFGNVLGSSGSLIPLFRRQLANGGPLTVTDPRMTRFFMTIREAVELTLQASSYGFEQRLGRGEIFVLDMGEPIPIIDIARRMIRLAGYTPDKEIGIKIVGCRPGEKLYEELFDASETRVASPVPGVLGAVTSPVPLRTLKRAFARLQHHAEEGDVPGILAILRELLPAYRRDAANDSTAGSKASAAGSAKGRS